MRKNKKKSNTLTQWWDLKYRHRVNPLNEFHSPFHYLALAEKFEKHLAHNSMNDKLHNF